MADWTLLDIVKFIYTWVPPILSLVSLALGFLTAFGRNKQLRLLGVWAILNIMAGHLGGASSYCRSLYDMGVLPEGFYREGTYQTVITVTGIAGFALTVLYLIYMWLYTKRSYDTGKGVLIAVLVISVVSPVLHIITNRVAFDLFSDLDHTMVSVYASSVSVIFAVATTCIFMWVFAKNRKKEKLIPAFWVFHLLFILKGTIRYFLDIGYIYNSDNSDYIMLGMLVSVLLALVFPAACFYLFKGSRIKVSNNNSYEDDQS